jgi:menaquinone-dependent protoporphyrinogen oxidase
MKILVTAASRHGGTDDIAAAIVRVLHLRGLDAEHVAPGEVEDLAGYDAVVLGSGVYAGRWLREATAFASRFALQLTERPVWLFSSGPLGSPSTPVEGPDVASVLADTSALEHRVFAGRLDKQDLGVLEKTMVRAVRAPEGDYRNWAEINQWAVEIADMLSVARL